MRTRTLITGAAFLAVGVFGARQASAQALAGSDTLEDVTENVITNCPAAVGVTYVGGGSTAGQNAMVSGSQHVASMSRALNAPACTANSRQLLVGLDGLSIVAKNGAHADPNSCTDDLGSGPLVLSGIPEQFIPCSSNTVCTTLFGAAATCDTVRQFCQISGTLAGCTAAQGCNPAGTYTFNNNNASASDDWQDVLRVIYGGMLHGDPVTGVLPATLINVAQAANDPNTFNGDGEYICQTSTIVNDGGSCGAGPPAVACPAGQFCTAQGTCAHQVAAAGSRNCVRNPARINCASPVRGVLLASYSQIVRAPLCTPNPVSPAVACTTSAQCPANSVCNTTIGQCVAEACVKVKHAFRRDDLSGTTDAFQALVGLISIPGFTTRRSTAGGASAPEIADFASTASPFCNAGTRAQNKGHSDGLDLDPYRRFCANGTAAEGRLAFESVCQAFTNPFLTTSDVACYTLAGGQANVTPATYPQIERSGPQGRGVIAGGSVDTLAALQGDYLQTVNGAPGPNRPRCLGVVQAVSIPQDLPGATVWSQFRYPQGGNCTPGIRAFVNALPARTIMCPDGGLKTIGGTCRLPQNTANGRFDCNIDNTTSPGNTPDPRVYNLTPVNNLGNMATLLDSYANSGFPGVAGIRRFARRYFGLHMVRPDNSTTPATIATGCTFETDTSQIGCLVKASPCSIGFAGREAADITLPFNNVALRVMGIQGTQTNIENLSTGLTPVYPMARKLWFNSYNQPGDLVGFETPNLTTGEQELSTCMGLPIKCTMDAQCAGTGGGTCNLGTGRCVAQDYTKIDAAISLFKFVPVPASVPRLVLNAMGQGCPL